MGGSMSVTEETLTADAIEGLAAAEPRPVLREGDDGYNAARAVWNGLIDRRPAVIVQCIGTADVIEAGHFGREHGLLVSIRGGAHNVAANAINDGGIVIDSSRMRARRIDPASGRVRVQG